MAYDIRMQSDTLENWNRSARVLPVGRFALVYDGWTVGAKAGQGNMHTFRDLDFFIFDIRVNGKSIRPKEVPYADLIIPVRMSQLENDGDGSGPFALQSALITALQGIGLTIGGMNGRIDTLGNRVTFEVGTINTRLEEHVGAMGTAQHGLAGGTNETAGFSEANFTQEEKTKLGGITPGGGLRKHTQVFNATTDWVASGDLWDIRIPADTHGCGLDCVIDVYRLVGGYYTKANGFPSLGFGVYHGNQDGTDTVLCIRSQTRFAGKVVIMG
jgi:hypothetical protein